MEAVTTGVQEQGVIVQSKHWLLNEQVSWQGWNDSSPRLRHPTNFNFKEYRRNPGPEGEAMSSNVDDRTIHELYVFPFMDSLKAGAASIMCSYQRVNNSYGCQNSKLLNGILKTELGFSGFVTSDWWAQHAGVASANAGMDLVMPDGAFWGYNLTEAVNNGSVAETRLNDMVTRILAAWYFVGQDEGYPEVAVAPYTQQRPIVEARGNNAALIREIGAAGSILVKNVNNTLPLKDPKYLSVYGYDARVGDSPWQDPARFGGGYEVNFGWNTQVSPRTATLNGDAMKAFKGRDHGVCELQI
jgi:beta-glucosidase